MLGDEVTKRWGAEVPTNTIDISFRGSAGSRSACSAPRHHARPAGDANHDVGKGLSGGRVIVVPTRGGLRRRRADHRRERDPRHGATAGELSARHRRRTVLRRPTPARWPWPRGSATTAASTHRWPRRRARFDIGPRSRGLCPGGIADVLDLPVHRVKTETVDLDPLDADDAAFLRDAVERHAAETGTLRWPPTCRRTGTPRWPGSGRSYRGLQRAERHPDGRARGPATSTKGRHGRLDGEKSEARAAAAAPGRRPGGGTRTAPGPLRLPRSPPERPRTHAPRLTHRD